MITTTRLLLGAAAVAALAGSACTQNKGPSCAQASAKFMGMLDAEVAKDGDPGRLKTARANRPALQDALLRACEEQKWSLATRQCMLDAKTAADTQSCVPTSTSESASEPTGTAPGAE